MQHLYKRFGAFEANRDLNFKVYRGEIFGFLGANGAGKTTAMKILCGLSAPSEGLARVAGYDVARHPEQVKQRIGYMSQRFSLYPDLSVWENIRLFGAIYGLSNLQIGERGTLLLQKLEMTGWRKRLLSTLSLGQKQKLAFSVALLHNPEIVFLDEPTGGVDPITRRQFWEMIYETSRKGTTVFVTTHYLDEAEYCDRITILTQGAMEPPDTPAQLRKKFEADNMKEVFLKLTRSHANL